jgi:hypothetical protein
MTLPRIEWPTAAVLVAVLALTGLVWWSSPDHRGDILAGIAAVGGVALSLMRALLASRPPAPPPHANGLDRYPLDASAADDDDDDTLAHRLRAPAALLAVSLCLTGCGASALRTHSTAASIASATIGDIDVRVAGACGVALSSCRGEATCREETVERCRVAAHAAEGLVASVRAYHDGITAATYADEGEVLPALVAAWRGIRDAWPAIRAALIAIGLDVSWTPEAL